MNILHYTIGIPPMRRGGSVQYAYDLMSEQSKCNEVFALTCGDTLIRRGNAHIKFAGEQGKIKLYSLTNPLTPTLIYGVSNPESQYKDIKIDYKNIKDFISSNNISIMHIHTFMGLHRDIVAYIKSLGVRIVYTTHDFHGICPHYNLIRFDGALCDNACGDACAICNQNEPSDMFLRIANSRLYQAVKRSGVFKVLGKPKAGTSQNGQHMPKIPTHEDAVMFDRLLEYYKEYFSLVDLFHFNSAQTETVFKQFLPFAKGVVIPVITSGITDKRQKIELADIIKFGFIGSTDDYKGFPLLKKVFAELYLEGNRNFKLLVYGSSEKVGIDSDCPLIEYKPPYKYSDIGTVFNNLNCIIVPSKWYETFSLVTLEALAHGIPVIVSDHVGAKDIVRKYGKEYVFSSEEELKSMILHILKFTESLLDYNGLIIDMEWPFSIEQHAEAIADFYGYVSNWTNGEL